jgi:hypothetical protein
MVGGLSVASAVLENTLRVDSRRQNHKISDTIHPHKATYYFTSSHTWRLLEREINLPRSLFLVSPSLVAQFNALHFSNYILLSARELFPESLQSNTHFSKARTVE